MIMDLKGLKIRDFEFWGSNALNHGGLRIYWETDYSGFGTTAFVKDNSSGIVVASETLATNDDKSFIKEIMSKFIEMMKIIG
jgi:hypothetical protein